jgi:25S rRNA (uracil2634-N3)-methyltransferase
MPRKKQKSGPAPRSHRPSGPAKPGPAPASQAKNKGSKPDPSAGGTGKEGNQKKQALQANQRPIVPFLRGDRILLVGEGKSSSFLFCIHLRCRILNSLHFITLPH